MATKRARKTQNQSSSIPVDRISKRPDPVIHHILSFLPTIDVVRLSILAKRWRRIWYSIPSLSFSDSDFSINDRKLFYKFVDECLRIRKMSLRFISDSVVTSFKLDIRYYGGSVRFDKWLSFAVKSKIQELELKMKPKCTNFAYYCLPGDLLKASSLVDVKLTSLKLEASFAISLPSLKSLSLASVELSDKVLHDVLLGCPSLEKLVLKECFDFIIFKFQVQVSCSWRLFALRNGVEFKLKPLIFNLFCTMRNLLVVLGLLASSSILLLAGKLEIFHYLMLFGSKKNH
ncbi:hypothetical protein UlMin_025209 [Ulmus minor]